LGCSIIETYQYTHDNDFCQFEYHDHQIIAIPSLHQPVPLSCGYAIVSILLIVIILYWFCLQRRRHRW